MKENGMKIKEVDKVFLTGNFGNNVDRTSVIKIGIFPKISKEKIITERNAAISGLIKCIVDKGLYKGLIQLMEQIEYIEIQRSKFFNDFFIENISFDKN